MSKKSNDQIKRFRIRLIELGMTQEKLAEELGVGSSAITMALVRGSQRGRVADWFRENLKINTKKNKAA